ncbi:hypothetical protein C0Q70_11662 [Pomacea canaliculata]|uniref:Uncharacterized protein n=1 Tax=Pomacea canaliculata TaxID=400727 RepID=A0A2T7P6K9_POMCA|nr:hypothetical protein C0Q70_11662 [Pomacea canaliculata]
MFLLHRTKCCQTRAKTRDRENCGGMAKEVPSPEDKDNRLSTHSCDVYVDLDDVSTTPLPDSSALCPATIQNGVRGPGGCDVIMFDNVAYVSGNDVTSKPDVTRGDDRDSDEVLMVDNDVYEPSSPVGTFKTFQNESTGDVSTDESLAVSDHDYIECWLCHGLHSLLTSTPSGHQDDDKEEKAVTSTDCTVTTTVSTALPTTPGVMSEGEVLTSTETSDSTISSSVSQSTSSTSEWTSTPSDSTSGTSLSTSNTSVSTSSTSVGTSGNSVPTPSTSEWTFSPSDFTSGTSQSTSNTSVSTPSTSVSTPSTSVSTHSTSVSTSSNSQPVSDVTVANVYIIVFVTVGSVALIVLVIACLVVRRKRRQTRMKTSQSEDYSRTDPPSLDDDDNRFSNHSCDVYVNLDDVSTTHLPDCAAVRQATPPNGVKAPKGGVFVMFTNLAHTSGRDVIIEGDADDNDEILMVDNDVYGSPALGTVRRLYNGGATGADNNNKDEVTMIDNSSVGVSEQDFVNCRLAQGDVDSQLRTNHSTHNIHNPVAMAMEGSGKLHCCSIVLLFLCGLLNTLQSVTSETKISTICNTTNSTWAMLSCSSDSWYHVIQELYSPVNTNCSLSYSNNYLQENSETGLDVSCAGPASPPNSVCSESVRSDVKDYNEALVDVTYECIPESKIYNLCLKQEVNLEGQVYLASPLMFTSPETSLFTNCSCEITGVLKAEVLYADVNSDVNITCGSWSSNEFLFLGPVVNIDLVLQDKPCTMRIIYRGDNRNVSTMTGRVWMKVSGKYL